MFKINVGMRTTIGSACGATRPTKWFFYEVDWKMCSHVKCGKKKENYIDFSASILQSEEFVVSLLPASVNLQVPLFPV